MTSPSAWKRKKKLAASEKRLRDILDSIFGFVGLYTLDGILIDCNRAPLEAAGVRHEDVVGKPFWEAAWWKSTTLLNRCACGT